MRGVHSAVDDIRRSVFTEVARLAYESASMPMDLLDTTGGEGVIRILDNPDSSLCTMELLSDGTVAFLVGAESPWNYFVMRFPYLWEVGEGKPTWASVAGTLRSVTVKADINGIWDARLDDSDSAAAFTLCPHLRQLTLDECICVNDGFAPAACCCSSPCPKNEAPVDLLSLFSLSGVYEDGCNDLMHNATSYCVAVDNSDCDMNIALVVVSVFNEKGKKTYETVNARHARVEYEENKLRMMIELGVPVAGVKLEKNRLVVCDGVEIINSVEEMKEGA